MNHRTPLQALDAYIIKTVEDASRPVPVHALIDQSHVLGVTPSTIRKRLHSWGESGVLAFTTTQLSGTGRNCIAVTLAERGGAA